VILAMLDRRLSGVFHVVGSQRISKYEFARSVARVFGLPQDRVLCTKISESDLRARRPLDTSLDTGKVATALGRQMPDVESGLRRFRDLYESGYPQIMKEIVTGEAG
jgi:dTDP-4-dehydrorhamnose reductase